MVTTFIEFTYQLVIIQDNQNAQKWPTFSSNISEVCLLNIVFFVDELMIRIIELRTQNFI